MELLSLSFTVKAQTQATSRLRRRRHHCVVIERGDGEVSVVDYLIRFSAWTFLAVQQALSEIWTRTFLSHHGPSELL